MRRYCLYCFETLPDGSDVCASCDRRSTGADRRIFWSRHPVHRGLEWTLKALALALLIAGSNMACRVSSGPSSGYILLIPVAAFIAVSKTAAKLTRHEPYFHPHLIWPNALILGGVVALLLGSTPLAAIGLLALPALWLCYRGERWKRRKMQQLPTRKGRGPMLGAARWFRRRAPRREVHVRRYCLYCFATLPDGSDECAECGGRSTADRRRSYWSLHRAHRFWQRFIQVLALLVAVAAGTAVLFVTGDPAYFPVAALSVLAWLGIALTAAKLTQHAPYFRPGIIWPCAILLAAGIAALASVPLGAGLAFLAYLARLTCGWAAGWKRRRMELEPS